MKDSEPIVFIVDDESVRKALKRLIKSVGMNVETFTTAREFLSHQHYEGPSCLVLDIRMPPLMKRVEELLEEGASSKCKLSGKCRRIINHREYLWTFVHDPSVEPTNNIAERIVRQGVLWRKSSFGTQSERGARYVERILTVCATCRLQGRSVIEYLRDACRCHLERIPAPPLITTAGNLAKTA